MKNLFIKVVLLVFAVNLSYSQEWMTNLDVAQKLAIVQNKMVLMVWEETTKNQYPVLVRDDRGRTLYVENLFTDEYVSPLIWKNFVPVIVSESQYADLYEDIKGKHKQSYVDMFNDDSVKIMDANGYIINVKDFYEDYTNISRLIDNYALNTEFLTLELIGYKKEKSFYSAYYLAAKYLDYALYSRRSIRLEIIHLSNIYLDEAVRLVDSYAEEEKLILKQRAELLKIQEYLILERPKKVLRQLNRMDAQDIENSNKRVIAFLYYTAYSILKDEKNAELWKAKFSSVKLKKAAMLINLNS